MYNSCFRLIFAVLASLVLASCVSAKEPQENPFQIGQIIYPNGDYIETHTAEELEMASQGSKVLDVTSEFVRVEYTNGSVEMLSFVWFEPDEMKLTNDWALGNPFHIGDEVCAIPDSVRENFPDMGTVTDVEMDFILIDNFGTMINWGHFQYCH